MNEIERKHTNARISRTVQYGGLVFLCGRTGQNHDPRRAGDGTPAHTINQ